jgi:hypothetical protein
MHTKIYFPGPIEGEVKAKDGSGRNVVVHTADVEPYFFKSDGRSPVIHLETVDARGKVIHRYTLSLGGKNGDLHLMRRNPCKPKYDSVPTQEEPETNNEQDS